MDPYDAVVLGKQPFDKRYEPLRRAQGDIRKFTARMDLNAAKPMNELSNTGFCLADVGKTYLVFKPDTEKNVTLQLPNGTYSIEWLDVETSKVKSNGNANIENNEMQVNIPGDGPSILFVELVQ